MSMQQAIPSSGPRLIVLPGGRSPGAIEQVPATAGSPLRGPWPRAAARWLLVAVAALTCPVEITALVLVAVLCAGPLLDGDQGGDTAGGDSLSHRGAAGLHLVRR